jgi:N-acyl-D-amino-acid deacylase
MAAMTQFDLVIKRVGIIDGTGSSVRTGDIGIARGKIVCIDEALPVIESQEIIDGETLVASPGFIDTHSHDDVYLLQNNAAPAKLHQGVTTVITGNCGMSVSPVSRKFSSEARQVLSLIGSNWIDSENWPLKHFSDYLNLIRDCHPAVNVVPLVGHLALRTAVMGLEQRLPIDKEMRTMESLLSDAIQSGAFGLSTGLVYNPGVSAGFDEILSLSKVAARFNGIYATHLRSEADQVMEAIEEALLIGRKANIPVHISHHKVMGRKNWNRSRETLARLQRERSEGFKVSCDVYPYIAGSTILAAAIPPSYHAEGVDSLTEKLESFEIRKAIKTEIECENHGRWENLVKVDTFDGMVINQSRTRPEYSGRSITDIADTENRDPYDVMFDLVREDPLNTTMIEFMMSEEDVERIIKSPLSMIGSDGIPGFGGRFFHPRFTSTFPRVLGHYVRDRCLLTLEKAVQKMTALPAEVFGLTGKGRLLPGYDADIVLFNPKTVKDCATFENPGLKPDGIIFVLVNGQIAIKNGSQTSIRSGKVLTR